MIRYGLKCAGGHGFDGWFRSSSDFEVQASGGMLGCPVCGSAEVAKALMAPAVRLKAASANAPSPEQSAAEAPAENVALVDDRQAKLREMLRDIRRHVTETSEDVGDRFPEVARKMHAQEIEHRSIRGKATAEEARALVEEGVEVQPLPSFPDDLN